MGGAVGKGIGGVGGQVNGVLSPLGLGGEQGAYYQPSNPAYDQMLKDMGDVNGGDFRSSMNAYANGGSMQDALQAANTQAQRNNLATGATTGSRFATDQVQQNPILGKLFGDKGIFGNEIAKEQELQNQGFQLTPQDREAYGQASGDIARLFGAQEQGIGQSLADRGLAAAPSGAAGIAFSGLQGNKNEQLAKSQMDIANARMANTMQRIGQQQNFISSLGQQAGNDINQQYGRQLEGAQNYQNNLANTAQLGLGQNQQQEESLKDKRASAGKTLFGAVGQGLYGGTSAGVGNLVSKGISNAGMPGGGTPSGMTGQGPTLDPNSANSAYGR